MANRRPPSPENRRPPSSPTVPLCRAVENWLADGRADGWSPRTLHDHKKNLERFAWWLENEAEVSPTLDQLSALNVRNFMSYLREAHETGRFGCSDDPGTKRAARPSSVHTYYRDLRAFTHFCLDEGILDGDPLYNVKSPKIPTDQIVPLSGDQVQRLLDAAGRQTRGRFRSCERDRALILLLVDSGLRASEVCALTLGDVDRVTGEIAVIGKGNKKRQSFLNSTARRALWRYVEARINNDAADGDPLFVSSGGYTPGAALTRSGVGEIVRNLGAAAGIDGVRVSPHTFRHTFAINFLRAGGNVLELQRLLGHESLEMTRRYVALANVDLAQSHRSHSPADHLKLK